MKSTKTPEDLRILNVGAHSTFNSFFKSMDENDNTKFKNEILAALPLDSVAFFIF